MISGEWRCRHPGKSALLVNTGPVVQHTIGAPCKRTRPGQSLVELTLLLPFLIVLLSIVIEAGLAINAWIRVNTAARDATRFAMDAGRATDIDSLVMTKLSGIQFGTDKNFTQTNQINIYIITGTTDASGLIPNDNTHWHINHVRGAGPSAPTLQRASIETNMRTQNTVVQNVPFTIVEVDFTYIPLLATIIARNATLPMSSYAIVQQYTAVGAVNRPAEPFAYKSSFPIDIDRRL